MPKHLLAALLALCAVLASPVASLAQPSEAGAAAAPAVPPEAEQPAEPSAASVAEPSAEQPAASAVTEPADVGEAIGMATQVFTALRSKEWLPAFAMLLMLLVYGLRYGASRFTGLLEGKWRMLGFTLTVAFISELALALGAGEDGEWSWSMVGHALAATMAAGWAWYQLEKAPRPAWITTPVVKLPKATARVASR